VDDVVAFQQDSTLFVFLATLLLDGTTTWVCAPFVMATANESEKSFFFFFFSAMATPPTTPPA